MSISEILEEERLDALDPLRHLRNDLFGNPDANADDARTNIILPAQRQTVTRQTLELQLEGLKKPLLMSVDARPGCGGVVWPAGEVSTSALAAHSAPQSTGDWTMLEGAGAVLD